MATECEMYPERFADRDTNIQTCVAWLRDRARGRRCDVSIVQSHNVLRDLDVRAYEFAATMLESIGHGQR